MSASFIRAFTVWSMIFGPTERSPHFAVSDIRARMPLNAGTMHEVDDEFQLVQTFEIRHLGLITCFDQGLEPRSGRVH